MRTMITKNCEWCGVEFTREKRRERRFCRQACAALWMQRNKAGSHRNRLTKRCAWCGVEIPPDRDPRTRFCSPSCGLKSRMSNPEHVRSLQTERKRQACREVIRRSDVKAKRMALIEEQRALGFPLLTYRNGSGPTVAQKILFDALPGAVMEYAFPMGRVGKPQAVDLVIPSLQLAIEVDGHSHQIQQRKEVDVRKEQILKKLGWMVLRFSNREILRNLPWVLTRIRTAMVALQRASGAHSAALQEAG